YVVRGRRATLRGEERLCPPDALTVPGAVEGEGFAALGDGFATYADALARVVERASRVVPNLVPSARDLLDAAAEEVSAGRFLEPEAALPVYLRDESAWRR